MSHSHNQSSNTFSNHMATCMHSTGDVSIVERECLHYAVKSAYVTMHIPLKHIVLLFFTHMINFSMQKGH